MLPAAYGALAGVLSTLAGFAAAAWAGTIGGSEWSWGSFRVAVARGESRVAYVVGTVVALAVMTLVAWLLLYGTGVLLILVGGPIAGMAGGDPLDPTALGTTALTVVAAWWGLAMQAAIGFPAAFVTRSQVAGIAAVVGLMIGEQLAGAVLPLDVLRLAPIGAGRDLLGQAANGTAATLAPAALVGLYLVAAVAIASLVARRAEAA